MFWVVATTCGVGLAINFTSMWFLNQTSPTMYRSFRVMLIKPQAATISYSQDDDLDELIYTPDLLIVDVLLRARHLKITKDYSSIFFFPPMNLFWSSSILLFGAVPYSVLE
ncbi:uncharacterized protein LOC131231606 isoform X1 [Magnolia sinica]|uniref:uncharacterized protein LOC131231606 isoform X1 n=1 Tax=Magnolia sinica TaxID=86752 RepID=UPI002658B0C2|nr:uncharacterized protein LOC131231606 isoform X1 [Magnolia sinica]